MVLNFQRFKLLKVNFFSTRVNYWLKFVGHQSVNSSEDKNVIMKWTYIERGEFELANSK